MSKTLLERAHIIRDEVAEAANTAYRVGQLLADMIVMLQQSSGDYLSSSHDDTAHGHITFAKGASVRDGLDVEGGSSLRGGATFGDFRSGIVGGRGGRIDGDGNAEVESLTVRSYLRATELLINRITAIEGDWLMTESGTVEHVEAVGGGRYRLRLRRRWDNDYTAFAPLDILKGVVNTMAARALGVVDAPDANAPLYATSWMLVQDVDLSTNTIGVQLYDDDPAQIPSGRNTPPVVGMNLARWGNQRNPERQSCLYLSSREGRIVHLSHVDSPLLSDSDVSSSFGTVPDFLRQMLGDVLAPDQDYVFARGLIVQDIIRLGADSLPIAEIVDRGVWQSDARYYHKSRNADTSVYEISDVWHEGAKWRCLASSQGVPPSASRPTQWLLLQAAPQDGRTSYLHIKYSSVENPVFSSQMSESPDTFIGTYADFEEADSDDPNRYTWHRFQGLPGAPGAPGAPGKDGKNGRDGVTTQANMLNGTDFKKSLSETSVRGRWRAYVSNSVFSKAFLDTFSSPIFGASVVSINSPDPSQLSSSMDAYSEISQDIDAPLVVGRQYVFSVYARRRNRGSDTKFWLLSSAGGTPTAFVATTEWKRYSLSFYAGTDRCRVSLRLWNRYGNKPEGRTILFSAAKLEEAGEATPWCLSENDKRGERGGSLRPRGMWSDHKDGVRFSAGTDGDPFLDAVTISTAAGTVETYYCTQSHEKSSATAPRADSAYWRKGDSFELISTRYALIGDANIDSAQIRQLRTAPEGHDRVVSIGAEQRTYAAGNAYPSIVQGFRQEGDQRIAVLEFYDGKTGALLYNLGPNGIFSALKRVGNKWDRAGLMWVGEYCTIRQLYEWVVKGAYPNPQLDQPDMANPEFGHQKDRVQIGQLGFGLWFTEGYTVLNNLGDSGQSRLYNVSRRGEPLYSSFPLFSLKPPVNGKRVFMVSDASINLYNNENYGPNDILVNSDGSENGDISLTVPPTGWYATRYQEVKNPGDTVHHEGLNQSVPLYTLELMRIEDGFITNLYTVYFALEDVYPLAGQSYKADMGRDSRGHPQEHLIP